ncbi:MAG: hypothetical protein CME32_22800 [Gimesia sp.]|nr:hypothetical protein [Gimesia sp.]
MEKTVTLRQKGTRIITVEEVQYRYRIRKDRDDMELRISIQHMESPGQTLLTGFAKPYNMIPVKSGGWWYQPVPHAVKPSLIRKLILAALEQGWQPTRNDLPAFYLSGSDVVSELPPPA